MIPLQDDNPTESFPGVTILLIAVNIVAFGYQLAIPPEQIQDFIQTWGFVPAEFNPLTSFNPLDSLKTVFTSMFLHGGLIHIAGNMLYLWVFGDNVEDELGHFNFLLFYLVTGFAGTMSQYFAYPGSETPMIGASGAIAGILGGYFLLYPSARVLTAVIIIIFIRLIYLPAWVLLGFWFLLQFLSGTADMGVASGANVAWFAHSGGFIAGFVLIFMTKYLRLEK